MALMAQMSPLEMHEAFRIKKHKETMAAIRLTFPDYSNANDKLFSARKLQLSVDALHLDADALRLDAEKLQQEVDALLLEAKDLKAKGDARKPEFKAMKERHLKEYQALPPVSGPARSNKRRRRQRQEFDSSSDDLETWPESSSGSE